MRWSAAILILGILCAITTATFVPLTTVKANVTNNNLSCLDKNDNGFVDIPELFDVIDAYFDRTVAASLGCVDNNGNDFVDIGELFDVIDAYFDRTPVNAPAPTMRFPGGSSLETAQIEERIIRFTNEERAKADLRPLELDPAISDIARAHSRNMAARGIFSHYIDGDDPTDRALAAGYNCRAYHEDGSYSYGLSENIIKIPRVRLWTGTNPTEYYADAETAAHDMVQSWMNSPGHRANILDRDSRRIGVGVAVKLSTKHGWTLETFYATQNFSPCS